MAIQVGVNCYTVDSKSWQWGDNTHYDFVMTGPSNNVPLSMISGEQIPVSSSLCACLVKQILTSLVVTCHTADSVRSSQVLTSSQDMREWWLVRQWWRQWCDEPSDGFLSWSTLGLRDVYITIWRWCLHGSWVKDKVCQHLLTSLWMSNHPKTLKHKTIFI